MKIDILKLGAVSLHFIEEYPSDSRACIRMARKSRRGSNPPPQYKVKL